MKSTTKNIKRFRSITSAIALLVLVSTVLLSTSGCTKATPETTALSVGSLKGPTSIGLAPLMDQNSKGTCKGEYTFDIEATADVLMTAFINNEIDAACIPANAAAIWYQKFMNTETGVSDVTVIDINTLGVLYVVGQSEPVENMSQCYDALKDRTLYMTGQGTTPEYVLNYLLNSYGYNPEDLDIQYMSEAAEVVSALNSDPTAYAILPQPYTTVAQKSIDGLNIVLSLSDAWDQLKNDDTIASKGGRQVTGVTIVRTSFLNEHPETVDLFLSESADSVDFVNQNPEAASEMVVATGIIEKAPIAQAAIPYCNLVCITALQMKDDLSGYLNVLFTLDPKSVGGSLPGDDFYYIP